MSCCSTPPRMSLTGGMRKPSWKLSVALALKLPGTLPPTSSQWPTEASQANTLPVAHQRAHQAEVVEVRAAVVGIVEQIGVARLEPAVARDLVDHGLDGERHGADEDRQAGRALHQGRAGLGVVEAVAGVVRLGDDRIERRAVERRVHLVGDLDETAVEHRERDRIERAHRLRFRSRRARLR